MMPETDSEKWDDRERVALPNLSAAAFVSDTDRAALENIQKIPLLPTILRKFNEMALDRISYARNSAESVRCGPKQYHTLYKMLQESCRVLEITEPELYIRQAETLNAYTSGTDRTFIVLHSSLVEKFTDEEILFIIGHECGHIKAGHVLYQELGRMLMPLLEMLGQATLGLGQIAGIGVVAAFYEWMRQAEMSCDRAGLLVCQDRTAALSGLMRLGGGSSRFDNEANLDTFLEQARNHSQSAGLEGLSKALLFVMYNWQLTHPQVVFRAKGLDEWEQSGAYDRIIGGEYTRDMAQSFQLGKRVQCPQCKKQVSATVSFCPNCGTDLHPERAAQNMAIPCGRCGEQLTPGTKFCPNCGASTVDAPPAYAPPPPYQNAAPPPYQPGQPQPGGVSGFVDGAAQGATNLWNAAKDAIAPQRPPGPVPPVAPYTPPPPVAPYTPPPPIGVASPPSPPVQPPPVVTPPPVVEPRDENKQ
ncbi:MAG: M48 family metallopeptidase [Armatimonadetes bacterium]|nr:M48 family metallopeptidase [Armatimonadota bacterium]